MELLCSSILLLVANGHQICKMYQCRCTAKELRMMGRKAARNTWSRNTNRIGFICWFYSLGIITMHGDTILKFSVCVCVCVFVCVNLCHLEVSTSRRLRPELGCDGEENKP